jgi:hypothetical protein
MEGVTLCQLRQYANLIAFDNGLAIVILNHFFQTTYNHYQSGTRYLYCKNLHDSAIDYAL